MRILLRLLPLVLAFGLLGPAGAPAEPTGSESAGERLDAFVRQQMDDVGVPGVAYAVVGPRGVVRQETFGEDGDGEAITPATPFLWGSVAKPVTATLVMRLVDDGLLRLDEPVVTYLPEFRIGDENTSARITIRQLLEQTSGLPEDFSLTDRFDDDREPADVLPELADRDLEAAPGEEHLYSSANYLVLAAVVEAVTGRSFPGVLAEQVLEPAGMDQAVTTPGRAADRVPPGHRFVLGHPRPFDSPYDPAGAAYGYLGGSLEDAVAFAQAHLGDSDALLDARTRQQMYREGVTTGEDRTYGLGWRRWPVDGTDTTMVWHSGAVTGYFASIILLPDRDRAVVVLQNVYGPFHENRLLETGFGLVDLLYGQPPETSGTHPMYPGALTALGAVCIVLAVLVALTIRRLIRPATGAAPSPGRAVAGLAAWAAALLAVMYAFAVALPGALGLGLEQVTLAAPDIAGLAYLLIGLAGVLLIMRVLVTAQGLRRRSHLPEAQNAAVKND